MKIIIFSCERFFLQESLLLLKGRENCRIAKRVLVLLNRQSNEYFLICQWYLQIDKKEINITGITKEVQD